ncbi:MAG: tRNA pseudouridine(55) synthase TruB [Erysipelotrichaceae bacterium]|nr:tRNA pseudouridine(55) synthase TruB [Erysipelotrichaceae bacterium]
MNKVLFLNKPRGLTSFDVCYRLRKILGTKKIGHTGTLDPNATGVMIVLFDKATKANQFLVSDNKEYECRVLLGIETDTLDIDGNITVKKDFIVPDKRVIEETLDSFLGESMQEVPLTSAVSVDGKRLYQYQRENKKVELPSRKINVLEIRLLEVHKDGFSFKAKVSSGTYIRSLARDICHKMGLVGTISELRRTRVDEVDLSMCDSLEEILDGNYHTHELLELLEKRYETVDYEPINDIYNGKKIKLYSDAEKIVIVHDGRAVAVYEKEKDQYRSLRGLW